MEECKPLEKENPRRKANLFSKLVFGWMFKICYTSNARNLELNDIYKCEARHGSAVITDRLQVIWDKEIERGKLKNCKPSLLKALYKTFWLEYLPYALQMIIVGVVLRPTQPLILGGLLRCFTEDDHSVQELIMYAGGLSLNVLLAVLFMHHISVRSNLIGMRLRIGISALVYRKILKLSQYSLSQTAAGQVVNLLSNDVARFDIVFYYLNYVLIAPLQLIIVTWLMWGELGPNCLIGIIVLLLLTLPLQMFMGKITSKYRMKVAKRTDYRVKIMSELLSGIQVIKMYAWEKPFEEVVQQARINEVRSLTKTSYARSILSSFTNFVDRTSLAVTIVAYVLLGNDIRTDLVYTLSLFYTTLQFTFAMMLPNAIAFGAESLISVKRLRVFLLLEEKKSSSLQFSQNNNIVLKNVTASWITDTPVLKNLNVLIPKGSLCAVIGPVGSGKSTILKLLIGELTASSGIVELSGNISYASQEPWIFSSSVHNNILFGQKFDREKYRRVVKVCALLKDFEQFPEGDRTIISDRGVSLSGGQRARINLARAVYQDSDIYLLDDPLSAVDTKVGRHLFDQCIVDYLGNKTRILVTHQLQYLKKADLIIILNKGGIEASGTFEELSQGDLDFTKILVASDESTENQNAKNLTRTLSVMSTTSKTSSVGESNEEPVEEQNMEDIVHLKGSALKSYLKQWRSISLIILVFFLIIFCQVLLSSVDYWLTLWTDQSDLRHESSTNTTQIEFPLQLGAVSSNESLFSIFDDLSDKYTDLVIVDGEEHHLLKKNILMDIYIFLIASTILFVVVRSILFYIACMRSSRNLHNMMFHSLLEAPMRFFDTNRAGRVLNRFSKDIGYIDEQLPKAFLDVAQLLLNILGIAMLVIIPNPVMTLVVVILGYVFYRLRGSFSKIGKAIKHLESIAKSPVFSHISSTIDGLTTIRSTKKELVLTKQFDDHQDIHTAAWYLTIYCSEAFGLWLDLMCVVFIVSVILGMVLLNYFWSVPGSFAGLAISQSLRLVGMLQYCMAQIGQLINYLISVERVLEYTELEQEFPLETPKGMKPKEPWPSEGKIIFRNLFLKYVLTDPPVLKNLNLQIFPCEKIGIVGRTGAGKSTLIAALFRLAPLDGEILIDGIDTQTLGLKDLRRKISIIPQEPVLFSATMRYNLDPFNEFEDDKLWNVLEEVELKDEVSSLDFMITEGGSNFSVGQRQLVCLARAILRSNKILILDEATANVDPKTDDFIQKTIRRKFKTCTVLTIAHRLNTIMDSDKVLVMESGREVEFDHPHLLLQDPKGYFTKMVEETGSSMTKKLRVVAEDAYKSKKKANSSKYVDFVNDNFPKDFSYQEFAKDFTAEFFDPKVWADLFKKSGAKYVVLTSKHHEGFTLWPSKYSFSWNAKDIGPHRDIVADLSSAVRDAGLIFGLYHSLYEWFNPMYLEDKAVNFSKNEFVTNKILPEMKELIETYKPQVLWSDGDWEAYDTYWKSTEFLAWLYNESPVKEDIVVNDRWGIDIPCKHGDFYSCADRFNPGVLQKHKWENAMTLDKESWGFRRNAPLSDYLTTHDLLKTLAETISCGGNILINVGPTKEGIIAPIFEERLLELGEWLNINGEAIYNSKPWTYQNDSSTPGVWYTMKSDVVYGIVLNWPTNNTLILGSVMNIFSDPKMSVSLLGHGSDLTWYIAQPNGYVVITFPDKSEVESERAWVLKINKSVDISDNSYEHVPY